MEILTFNKIRTIFYKKLNIIDTFTTCCDEYDKYTYSLNNNIKIMLFVDNNTDIVDKVELYLNNQCIIIIKPYSKLIRLLCKLANKLDTTYSLIKENK